MRIAGVDEVGRGALFGPVVAAAVVLDDDRAAALSGAGVRDSKRLSPKRRQALVPVIQTQALDWAIAAATVAEIDQINILQASLLAMDRAIAQLDPPPDRCDIDGNQPIPNLRLPQQTLIGGDRTSIAIAAASILAKVWRDDLILKLAQDYPAYDLAANKGYGTAKHLAALREHGLSPHHRRSFGPCQQLTLPL
ncbi:MAG: ribonuclease HII [Cyanophyceae cyanobacterium]